MRVVFSNFCRRKKFFLATAQKSCIKKLLLKKKIWIFFAHKKVEKIGCHSRFNPECNTERSCIDSLYIALGTILIFDHFPPTNIFRQSLFDKFLRWALFWAAYIFSLINNCSIRFTSLLTNENFLKYCSLISICFGKLGVVYTEFWSKAFLVILLLAFEENHSRFQTSFVLIHKLLMFWNYKSMLALFAFKTI